MTTELSMPYTDRQLKQLRTLIHFRTSPPSVFGYVKSSWRSFAYQAVLGIVTVWFFAWGGWPIASGFFGGFCLAVMLRDLRWFRVLTRNWPLSAEITDWHRVEAILGEASSQGA